MLEGFLGTEKFFRNPKNEDWEWFSKISQLIFWRQLIFKILHKENKMLAKIFHNLFALEQRCVRPCEWWDRTDNLLWGSCDDNCNKLDLTGDWLLIYVWHQHFITTSINIINDHTNQKQISQGWLTRSFMHSNILKTIFQF